MLIRYPDGSYAEGAIHRLEGNTLRTTVAGVDDAVEYTLVQNGWTSKTGVVVTFDFTSARGMDLFQVETARLDEGVPGCAAGGDCALRRISDSGAGLVN